MTTHLKHEIPDLRGEGQVLSWIHQVSGADVVYPGHPVVIACTIIGLYGDVNQVTKTTEHGSRQALADMRVPGAGDCVRAAVHALTSGCTVDEMLDYMNQYWSRGRAGGHLGNVNPGIAQAILLEPYFRENVEAWLGLGTSKHATPTLLTDELEALVNEVAVAVRSARLMRADVAISEVRELCHLINLEDKAGKPRAEQMPATLLHGVLKGFGISGLITNRQIADFALQIFTQNNPDQPRENSV